MGGYNGLKETDSGKASDDRIWVFLNILLNARKAIIAKGAISITTQVANEWADIDISNDGYGIGTIVSHQILDVFYTTKTPGTSYRFRFTQSWLNNKGTS